MKKDTTEKFKKFWVMSVNNWICDADYSGKELKARNPFPSFRKFSFIKSWERLQYFTKRDEISNIDHVASLLNIEPPTPSKEDSKSIEKNEWVMVEGLGNTRIADTNGRNICSTFSESDEFASLIAAAPQLLAENTLLKEQNRMMKEAIEYYQNGVDHFFKKIDWGKSFLDAKAITFMNEHGIKFNEALNNLK